MSEIFKSSLSTLKMNGRRTFLTMIGIIIGIAAVITILSLGNGFRKKTLDELAQDSKGRPSQMFHFNVSNMDADWSKLDPFDTNTLDGIRQIPGVDEVVPSSDDEDSVNYATLDFANKESKTYGTKYLDVTNQQILYGRNLYDFDSKAAKRNVIIDDIVASDIFENPEKAIHQSIKIDGTSYMIVGVYATELTAKEIEDIQNYGFGGSDAPQVIVPRGTNKLLNPNTNVDFSIKAFYKPDSNVSGISRKIADYLKENGSEKDNGTYEYFDMSEMMESIGQQVSMVTYFIGAVAGISLFIAGVGVMNMMYISVSERTKEIGIRRSLGATQNSIQWQFLLEGISITTLGGLIGYLFGVGIAIIAGNFLPFKALIDVPTALISVSISVLIGISFSVFPARAAARKNVVEILR
ncbi:ABC transporter permease [Globicatella sp. PHS-GS-PNBC-21-1553]|uniref:ABC transporter permease n=1 Tax=Globicatella sp. PHS-GS-PNBC-21-1553 TaxID=2885764 RepID=UPI00298ED920|nr:ABC transporter permease [Globicatella sp. PHS-GS-PNBC-21-1553]WPC08430.1 ABC transporter permease [Globicatella sp. PHS-GS-PNBC-21-1553]